MKTILSDALNVSLESQADDVASLSPEEVELSIESTTLDLVTAEHGLTMENYRLAEIEQAVTSLEKIGLSIESALQEDDRGLDKQTATAYQHAVRAVMGDAIDTPILSLESFETDTQRQHASLESVDRIKELIKRLIEAMKKVGERVVDFVQKMVKAFTQAIGPLRSKLTSIEKRLTDRNLNRTASISDPIDLPNVARLAVLGAGNAPAKIDEAAIRAGATNALSYYRTESKKWHNLAMTAMRDVDTIAKGTSDRKYHDAVTGSNGVTAMNTFIDREIAGKISLPSIAITSNAANVNKVPSFPATVEVTDLQYTGANEVPVLGHGALVQLMNNIKQILALLPEVNKWREELSRAGVALSKVVESTVTSTENEESIEGTDLATLVNYSKPIQLEALARIDTKLFYYLRTAITYLDMCTAQYEEASKPAEA